MMEYRLSTDNISGGGAVTPAGQEDTGRNVDSGLNDVRQGQILTGTVESVEEQVTLDFNGQQVIASKDILGDVKPGEVKNFEVVKATPAKIELRLLDSSLNPQKAILSIRVDAADIEIRMAEKEQFNIKAEHENRYLDIKSKLEQIGAVLTEQDLDLLEKEDFPIESFSVDGLKEALGRVKTERSIREDKNDHYKTINSAEKENSVRTDQKEADTIKADTIKAAVSTVNSQNNNGNTNTTIQAVHKAEKYDKAVLTEKLKGENLPATEENLLKLSVALKSSDAVSKMDDRAIQYLISRRMEPTIENIYKALYSKGSLNPGVGVKLSETAWKELEGQVKEVILAAGYEVSGKNMSDARWLLESQLPLTEETFTYKKDLDSIRLSADPKVILDKILAGMKNGINPKDVSLRPVTSTRLEKVIADTRSISAEAVSVAVKKHDRLTIKNLSLIQKEMIASEDKTFAGAESYVIKKAAEIMRSAGRIISLSKEIADTGADMKNYMRENTQSMKALATNMEKVWTGLKEATMEISTQAEEITKAGEVIAEEAGVGEANAGETRAADTKTAETNTVDAKVVDAKVVDTKTVKTKAVETKTAETIAANTKTVETKVVDNKAVETKAVETKTVETKTAETKTVETKTAETKTAEAKTDELKVKRNETRAAKIPYSAAEILQKAAKIAKEAVAITHSISEVTDTAADPSRKDTKLPDKVISITKAAVDITREISDIAKSAMKLIDVTQDIEKPVTNLVQTPEINPDAKDGLAEDETQYGKTQREEYALDNGDDQYEELKARRLLEEVRLKMTLEAAGRLEGKGIKIDTEELSRVVDALREQELRSYKNRLSEAEVPVSETNIQTLKQTTQGLEQLKYLPCAVIGATLQERNSQTITGLLDEGSKLQAEYAKAGIVYETLATVPNREYGDSIKKAFSGADSLLRQVGLDDTEQNRRAVRILGYNQMEITKEAVSQVKAYDLQVTELIKNLHPAVAVRMIKEGINPLQMPISELNHTIDQIKENQGITSEDKFSTYLRDLEKQEGITSEERKAYIGIYRLLYNIDKSDGAALGAVIKSDREVTLGNLLTAVMTAGKGRLDAVINDEFGTLQSITHTKETIAQQLSTFTDKEGIKIDGPGNERIAAVTPEKDEEAVQEQTEYLNRVIKEIKDNLTPKRLAEVSSLSSGADTQALTSQIPENTVRDQGVWESVRKIPVEKLLEQLRNTEGEMTRDSEEVQARVQQLQELSKNAEQSIRFLNDYRIPSTPLNILMAHNLLSNGDTPLKKLIKQKVENPVEISEKGIKELNNLSDKLVDKSSMLEAYEALETKAKDSISQACRAETIDSRRLAELKSTSRQITFIRTLAEKEFYQIPIETEQGITNINLTILRGTEASGTVSVGIRSEQLGEIKAEFTLKDNVLKGYFGGDNRVGLELLQSNTSILKAAVQESGITLKQLDYGVQKKEKGSFDYHNPGKEGKQVSKETERILYRIAKAVVMTVRAAENSKEGSDRAVS